MLYHVSFANRVAHVVSVLQHFVRRIRQANREKRVKHISLTIISVSYLPIGDVITLTWMSVEVGKIEKGEGEWRVTVQ
jgi:hypothetical protein